MHLSEILTEMDWEITRLQQARALLAGDGRGVGKRSIKAKSATEDLEPTIVRPKKKRNLSPEGRKRIAEAVRRRWELQKKASSK